MQLKKPATAGPRQVDYANPTPTDQLKALLLQAGLSQRQAARELDVAERTMRYWCVGNPEPPRMAILALERLVELRRMVTDK